jgi:ribulose-phosphate 3-epimerase
MTVPAPAPAPVPRVAPAPGTAPARGGRPPGPTLAASVLPADFTCLGDELRALEAAGVERVQWDVMDGRFVPNLTLGPDIVAAARPVVGIGFEAHLMVADPDPMLPRWIEAGCERVIVHAETCPHLHRTVARIAEFGALPGVALNPATPLSAVEHVLDQLDLVLVMTVDPGFGGQRYLSSMEPKIRAAAAMIAHAGLDVDVEVDGGIDATTAPGATRAGATVLVAGTALFRGEGSLGTRAIALRSAARLPA